MAIDDDVRDFMLRNRAFDAARDAEIIKSSDAYRSIPAVTHGQAELKSTGFQPIKEEFIPPDDAVSYIDASVTYTTTGVFEVDAQGLIYASVVLTGPYINLTVVAGSCTQIAGPQVNTADPFIFAQGPFPTGVFVAEIVYDFPRSLGASLVNFRVSYTLSDGQTGYVDTGLVPLISANVTG